MTSTRFKFNDFYAPGLADVVSITWPGAASRALSTVYNNGADWEQVAGGRMKPFDIKVKFRVTGTTRDPETLAMLWKSTVVANLKPMSGVAALYIDDANGWYYVAYVTDMSSLDFRGYAVEGSVTFHVPKGVVVKTAAINVALSGTASITVDGSYPALASFSGNMTAANGVCSFTVDGTTFAVELSGTKAVTIDFERHILKVANVTTLPTIQSDWPIFSPGTVAFTMVSGSISGTLTLHERRL